MPPPRESDIDYDALYPSRFSQPATYIRFSNTVEECISCQYDMTTEDETFLKQYNGSRSSTGQLSEDDFERLMDVYESTASEHTPFAAVDNTNVPYDLMVPSLNQLGSAQLMQHAKAMYNHWSARRQDMGNKPLHPTLKSELHQETDDADPYVCFRRREARQTRKTRARDVQMADRMKRLRRELEDGRQLVLMTYEREMMKRELVSHDRQIFEHRALLRKLKVQLKIKGDEEELINQKVSSTGPGWRLLSFLTVLCVQPKKKSSDAPALARQPQRNSLPIALRPDGRSMEADLVQLSDKLAEKENEVRKDVEFKIQQHRNMNKDYVDLTWRPLSPVKEPSTEITFRPAKTQYLMTPPASASDGSMDIDEESCAQLLEDKKHMPVFQFTAGGRGKEQHQAQQPAFRRRMGRLNRLWIDRRGLGPGPVRGEVDEGSDQWKYDHDDDEEDPVFELDPYDNRALKFRALIPPSHVGYTKRAPPPAPPALQTQSDGGNGSVVSNAMVGRPVPPPLHPPAGRT